jgi:parallel beta-helix repeat protein
MKNVDLKRWAVCLLGVALSAGNGWGDTNLIAGEVTNHATWSGDNLLQGTVLIRTGVVVNVEPGTRLLMNTGAVLRVEGQLLADGTAGEPIQFTRSRAGATWERLLFVRAADSRLQHCVIEYANCVGDHKDYYDNDCNPATPPLPRRYHEAVVVLASHVDFDGCSFTNLPDASATAEGDALAIVSDDVEHPGAASATVRNCNFVRIGQGVHTRYAAVLVENCFFKDKHGDNDDVDLVGESTPPSIIRNNLFQIPSYDDRIHPTRCSALIYGNTIYGSSDHGIVLRDVSRPIVFNNVLYNCSAGGISVQNECDALLANNTLVNCNRAIKLFDHVDRHGPPYCLTPGSGKATVLNCIIWNCNPAFDLADSAEGNSYVHVSYSDIQGGVGNATKGPNSTLVAGPGNIDSDPLFVSRAATNFHLLPGSLCIDAGTNLSAVVAADFDGTPRPLDGNGDGTAGFDIGAYEFLLATADSNGDGIPDGWCQRYRFNPMDPSVASGNPDNDPCTTFQEYVADTDPTDALSYFRIAAISNLPPVTVYFPSSSNRLYMLFYSTNLGSNPAALGWTNLAGQTDIPGAGGTGALADTNVGPARFYRVGARISR